VRLFDRRFGRWSGEDPHDRVVIDGPIEELTAPILHDPYRDLTEHLVTIARYAELSAGGPWPGGGGPAASTCWCGPSPTSPRRSSCDRAGGMGLVAWRSPFWARPASRSSGR
jgi:hypothetical protein